MSQSVKHADHRDNTHGTRTWAVSPAQAVLITDWMETGGGGRGIPDDSHVVWRILKRMDLVLPVGTPSGQSRPLARFLPPLDEGVIERIIARMPDDGSWILDPFGISPQLAREAARAGKAIRLASSNPVTRFVIEHTLQPFDRSHLQSALAKIAALPKDETRMEHFLLDLYRSHCAQCGERVEVDYFIWDREIDGPTDKFYTCRACNFSGESHATEEDWEGAKDYSRKGLQYALALERVASPGDPDRRSADAALSVYTGRAIFALVTLLNKLEQLSLETREASAVDALMLSAFDSANSLWSHPEGRVRPLQLIASPRFREYNIWRALEQGVGMWEFAGVAVPVQDWQADRHLAPGEVMIYPGSVREMVTRFSGVTQTILSVPPRPNQAYWTLSALWAAWLWGKDAASTIKAALRRRRYDWSWHANALQTTLGSLTPLLDSNARAWVYLPESEPGFFASLLVAFDGAGYRFGGSALRVGERQAYFEWRFEPSSSPEAVSPHLRTLFMHAIVDMLRKRGEPAPYALIHAAAWSAFADLKDPGSWLETDLRHPISHLDEILEEILSDEKVFSHLGKGIELESGQYYLHDTRGCAEPLSDRVENSVMNILREEEKISFLALEERICQAFTGMMTPDRRFIYECLLSYAQASEAGREWSLRPEDRAEARESDRMQVVRMLHELGARLGYEVYGTEEPAWQEGGKMVMEFKISETTALGEYLLRGADVSTFIIVPGGRASLITERMRRDPRLQSSLQAQPRVIKFRHVRRLAEDPTLDRSNLRERLFIDPPEQQDPQLRLL